MSELLTNKMDHIRSDLQMLLKESSCDDHSILTRIEEVFAENERLQQEVARLRRASQSQGSSYMSTKLRDALRE